MKPHTLVMIFLLVVSFTAPVRGDWKGWVHTHTVFSDGAMRPRELAAKAARAGVQFVLTLDHYPGIENQVKEINLRKTKLGPEFTGIDNYLRTWEILTKETGIVFVPGIEYTFKRSHLGIINITQELHKQITIIFDDKRHTDEEKIRDILALVRNSTALPLICHPTLKMVHPQKGMTKYQVTDYSFDYRLWKDEPIVLVEFMNNGNMDDVNDLIPSVLNAGDSEHPSVVIVAGVDFHSTIAEIIGIHGNRLLKRPSHFPEAFKRFTWIKTDRADIAVASILDELCNGNTYLTYGEAIVNPERIGRQYYEYTEEGALRDIYARAIAPGGQSHSSHIHRDDSLDITSSTSGFSAMPTEHIVTHAANSFERTKVHRYLVVSLRNWILGPFFLKPPNLIGNWKRVHFVPAISTPIGIKTVSIEVPIDWEVTYEKRLRTMDHVMGYQGNVGAATMKVMSDWKRSSEPFFAKDVLEYLALELDVVIIINAQQLPMRDGQPMILMIDWIGVKKNAPQTSGTRRIKTLVLKWSNAPEDYFLDIEGDPDLYNEQQELYDRIAKSITTHAP